MFYFLGALILASLLVILIFIRTNKDTKRMISYKDRAKLESSLESSQSDSSGEPVIVRTPRVAAKSTQSELKVELPKDFKNEILRFKYFKDPDDENFNVVFNSAISKLTSGDYKNALYDFNGAVDLKPFSFQVIYCRGLLKSMMGNFIEAINDFTETVRLEIDEKNALYFRGIAKYESKDLIGADQDLNSFVMVVPQFAESYYYLGLICSKQHRTEEAIEYFSKVIKIKPNHGEAFFERGMAYQQDGNKEKCCKDLKTSFRLGNLEAYHFIKENCEEQPAESPQQN
jgi:tetratricopeptide (TPR) repeat protein